MKRSEIALWMVFLLICFGLGFGHGRFRPDMEVQNLKAKEIKILVSQAGVLAPNFLSLLSFETEAAIQVDIEPEWQKFQANVIASNGYHLLVAPAHWFRALEQFDQLMEIGDVASEIPLANDFPMSPSAIPIGWFVTEFWRLSSSNFAKVSDIKQFYLFRDESLTKARMLNWEKRSDVDLRKKTVHLLQLNDLIKMIPTANSVVERPHTQPPLSLHNSLQRIDDQDDLQAGFLIFSLAIPRSTGDQMLSKALVSSWFRDPIYANFLQTSVFASTLTKTERYLAEIKKKASYLRYLEISKFNFVGEWDNVGFERLREEYHLEYQ